MDPASPIIGAVRISVLEVPVIPSIGKPSEWIVGSDSISTPTGDCDTEMLNIVRTRREVNTIDVGIDRCGHCLDNTEEKSWASSSDRRGHNTNLP